ncbi:MAG: DNA adenine methylase, partial [Polyangiales bacterium]
MNSVEPLHAWAPQAPAPFLPAALPEPTPFVKWAGGKGRLLAQLETLLPHGVEHMRHVEPFVGGGALFFRRKPARALLADINAALIDTYIAVRDQVEAVIAALHTLAAQHDKDSYYAQRSRYNQDKQGSPAGRAALFIYLNKTCFNGLYRVNRRGEFNVPVGSYTRPTILNPVALRAASKALQGIELRPQSFEALIRHAKPGDFIYFDPPYLPTSTTASFTQYAEHGFDHSAQLRLRDLFFALDRRGAKLMLSNSDVPFIRNLYRNFN